MIKPKKDSQYADDFFVVVDIENKPSGEVIDIDLCWRDDEGELKHKLFTNWTDTWKWLIKAARQDKRFRKVYAHNGGGWDWLSLVEWLLSDGKNERQTLSAITAGSGMVVLSVKIEQRFTIQFCDSLQLLRSSLDRLSKTILGKSKVETDGLLPHELKEIDEDKYYRYLRTDTENLIQVLEKTLELLREKVVKVDTFGPTIGSTAMKVFQTLCVDDPITIPTDKKLRQFLRQGYTGGRVEVFKYGHFEDVKVYDINSLYPSAMLQAKVPVSDRGFWTEKYEDGICGLFRGTFIQRDKSIPPVLFTDGVGRYENKGVYFTPELDLLKRVDSMARFEIQEGYVFVDTEKIFASYVNRLYNIRLSDPDGPVSLLCKFLLNSLYGKFGQKSIREKIVAVNDFNELFSMVEDGAVLRDINKDLGIYGLETEHQCSHEHVGIAGIITSYSRTILYEGLMNAGNVVYCDTDSVHTTDTLHDCFIGKGLGKYKLEFEGEGIYCGKKLYALRNSEGKEKLRAKGVSIGGRNGSRLSFDDYNRLLQGEKIACTFDKPSTPKQVFGGKTACKFSPKTRRIRVT